MQTAWVATSLGGWTCFIALAVYAYDVGGASLVGVAALVRMAPAAVAAPAMSLLGDRHSRRNVLLALSLVRASVLAGCAALVWAGGSAVLVFALAALFTAIGTGHRPAQAALLPVLAEDPRQLTGSNALWSAVDSVGFVAGSLCGGLLVALGGVELALSATAAVFALSAVALAGIPADRRAAEPPAGGWGRNQDLLEGFQVVRADRDLRLVVGVLGMTTLVEGAIDVLVVLVALELLQLGAAGVGWLNSAWGVGGVLGGMTAAVLIARGCNATGLMLGSLCVGVPLLVLSAVPAVGVAVVGLVVLGVGYAVIEVAGLTLVQRLASDAVLARAFGVVEGTYWLTTGLGSLLAPVLVALFGLRGALLAVGIVLPLLVLARYRSLLRLEASAPVPEAEYTLLRRVGIFAPLPVVRIEELARRVEHVRAGAGDTIIREGESGDRFYVIADGAVEVTERGRFRRVEEIGDCFGEIALLRATPRTATVVARTDVDLLALERDEFLAAITGDRRALAAGHELADARLTPA
ncbi:MFS transporter [Solirubrobacter taibaiensis]|nr:MFS transporter [Solirubrobacter taibaiensis]